MATIRLYNEFGSARFEANTPRSLKIVLNKAEKNSLSFEVIRGLEYNWVRQTILNHRESIGEYLEIV